MGDEALQKGQELLQQANGTQGGSGKGKAALFHRAANEFKKGEHWQQAAEAFCESAKLRQSLGRPDDEAMCYGEAASCYRQVNTQKAIECLQEAIKIHMRRRNSLKAAHDHEFLGEIYDETGNSQLAAKNFEKAAAYYCKERDENANKCTVKAAHLFADIGEFVKAACLFEELGKVAMHDCFEYLAQDHFLKACLCLMNKDVPKCKKALKKFAELDPPFTNSCKYQLLQELVAAANPKKSNPGAFKEAVDKYFETSKPELWTERLLNSLKQRKGGN